MFIKPSEGRITSPFGMRTHPVTRKPAMHWGIDYGKDGGTRIVASADGVVVRARNAETDGYGKLLILEHTINGKLYSTVYAHLASISVKDGQRVKQGETIAVMGTTGVSTGVHLHFEIHVGKYKYTKSVDPLLYITIAKPKEATPVAKTRYSDVSEKHTAYNALERLSKAGIVSGYEDGTFRPNEPMTRAHVAVLIDKALNGKG